MTDTANATSKDVAIVAPKFESAELRSISSFEDAVRLLADKIGQENIHAADELGDGFMLLPDEDKDTLKNIPCLFLTWQFNPEGKFGEFVSARVVANFGNGNLGRYILNDGGTGIYAQLREFTDANNGTRAGMYARHGLRRSDYMAQIPDPKTGEIVPTPATTFYIDTTP